MKKWINNVFNSSDIQETEHQEKIERRSSVILVIMGFILLALVIVLIFNSGAAGLSKRAAMLKEYAIRYEDDITILPGDIYDRNGTRLSWSEWSGSAAEGDGEAEEADTDGQGLKNKVPYRSSVRYYIDGEAYTQVLGYTGKSLLQYDENVYIGRDDYRLMRQFSDALYTLADIDDNKGQNLTLTLDHDLQMRTFELLTEVMGTKDKGSAVVMDAKTGEILSMVSLPTFDLNELSTAKAEMYASDPSEEVYYPVTHKGSTVPGSIFKLITTVCLLDNDMEDMIVSDTPFTVDGWTCNNSYSSQGDEITYFEAIERSSNVYFALAALALGVDKLNETAEKFMLNTENDCIELDFANIETNWDTDDLTEAELAQTGFGQGRTEFTTLYAAMVAQTIANDGIMMKPYLIKEISDTNGKVLSEGSKEVFSEVTSKSTANKITEAMLAVMQFNREHHEGLDNDEDWRIVTEYQVAGKTGTGQLGDSGNNNNAWFISFAPADDPQYIVAVNQCGVQQYGFSMIHTAAQIYKYLFEGK